MKSEPVGIRIGIDGRPLQGSRRGDGRYLFEFCLRLHELLGEARFFIYSSVPVEMPVRSSRWTLRTAGQPFSCLPPLAWLKTRGAKIALRDNLDVFWGTNTFLPPLKGKVRTAVTVHDLCHVVIPETYRWSDYWINRFFVKKDILQATRVMSVSHGTAARVLAFTGRDSTVVKSSAAAHFSPPSTSVVDETLARLGIEKPYLLAVGAWEPRKNFEALVKAFLLLKTRGELPGHKLVLVGKKGWKYKNLEKLVADDAGKQILWLGYVPEEDLPGLYTGADLLVFPSLYEGFGIPLLEARACGTRIVASNTPETREAGGPDAVYVKPDVGGLCQGIRAGMVRGRPSPSPPAAMDDDAQTLAAVLCKGFGNG